MFGALLTGLAGVVFGLALAAPPGPMNAIIAAEAAINGWSAGFRAGLGAMTADATFFVLSLLGVVTFVDRFPVVRAAMVGLGGLLMLYFAHGAAVDARSFRPSAADAASTQGGTTGFRKALALALTNPYQILFWLTVGVGMLQPGEVDVLRRAPYVGERFAGTLVVQTGSPALLVGFFGGILLWITGFPTALVVAERRVKSLAPVAAGGSAVVLAGFGLLFLSDAVRTLLA